MKREFIGYFKPSKDELEKSWKSGLIVLDTNTLLNFYRYTNETKNDFFNVLKELSTRLWLPYQVASEFHNKRIKVIQDQEKAYEGVKETISSHISKLKDNLNSYKRHNLIKTHDIIEKIDTRITEINLELSELKKKHPNYIDEDPILDEISNIFDDVKVGKKFNDEELEIIYKEGEHRYKKGIPPGFCDKDKTEKDRLYGDLVIWKEIITKIKLKKENIIFVTDDRKEDWWRKIEGKTIGPREELIKEFYDETGVRILIYQADIFLKFAKDKLQAKINNNAIKEIRDIRKEDEKYSIDLFKINSVLGNSIFNEQNNFLKANNSLSIISNEYKPTDLYSTHLNIGYKNPLVPDTVYHALEYDKIRTNHLLNSGVGNIYPELVFGTNYIPKSFDNKKDLTDDDEDKSQVDDGKDSKK